MRNLILILITIFFISLYINASSVSAGSSVDVKIRNNINTGSSSTYSSSYSNTKTNINTVGSSIINNGAIAHSLFGVVPLAQTTMQGIVQFSNRSNIFSTSVVLSAGELDGIISHQLGIIATGELIISNAVLLILLVIVL